jgi:prepilin-type N-terminal cleavage/methylation domain-containing protein
MTRPTHEPTRAQTGEAPPHGKQPGFTLVELLISITLFGVILASTIGLLMSQRNLYDVQGALIELQGSVRASVDLVAGELRSVPPLGVTLARPDSITVHYPIQWGMVCGLPADASDAAEIFLRAAEDALFADQVQIGYGIKEPDGDWTFFEEADPLWGGTLYAETLLACKEGAGAKFQSETTYNKDGTVSSFADTISADYVRFDAFAATTGSTPVGASQFIVYTDITYRFGPSTFQPGTRALFRNMPGASQELTGLFSEDAGFEYLLKNGTRTNTGFGNLENIEGVLIKARSFKEVNVSGAVRALEYDASVMVPFRNF